MPLSAVEFAEIMNGARALQAEVNTNIPARVVAYDPVSRRADVRPEIDRVTADGRVIDAPVLYGIKVKFIASTSSDAIISLPLGPGDGGLLHFSQRSIEEFMEGERVPQDSRMHDLNDAFFAPGVHTDADNVPADPDALMLRIGLSVLKLYKDGRGTLALPSSFGVKSPVTNWEGVFNLTGKLNVSDFATFAKDVNVTGDVFAGPISLKLHRHVSAAPGSPTSSSIV
jgi:hypothetical protein